MWHFLIFARLVLLVTASLPLWSQTRAYVANLGPDFVTIAWGRTDAKSGNSIGYDAIGIGEVSLKVGSQTLSTSRPWFRAESLNPDTTYQWSLIQAGSTLASGEIRTWPRHAKSLTFFVIGDWGNGSYSQYEIGARMAKERARLESEGQPVRFVMSTGDNIYLGGSADRHWEKKFFAPYAELLRYLPFYAVLGNHDGNESERAADLPVYLDNFFSPAGKIDRWYKFEFADLAQFYALDSTTNQFPGPKSPAYLPDGEQSQWLTKSLAEAALPWRIAYFHHPPFTAGPNHRPALNKLSHWLRDFQQRSVSAVFTGHEHNLQFSQRNAATGEIQFIVSGAGGELRKSSVRSRMQERNIASWAPQVHFLVVQIEADEMRITPVTAQPLRLVNPGGDAVSVPIVVPRRR